MDTTGTLVVVAVQVTPLPPLSPLQVHSLTPPGEGNAGVVGSVDPDAQKALLAPYPVSLKEYVFAADQQVPLMGLLRVHVAVVPVPCPVQDQTYWIDESVVSERVPAVQTLFVVQHAPLMGVTTTGLSSTQFLIAPPFNPLHDQTY